MRIVVLALAALAFTAAPAHAKTCANPKFPGSGYFTSLAVKKVGCATGKKIALGFTACRRANGPSAQCRRKVRKYSCNEQRQTIKTEFDGLVTCKKGSKQVKFSYQQNT